MLYFTKIDNFSYRVSTNSNLRKGILSKKDRFNHLQECRHCICSRNISNLRKNHENLVRSYCLTKSNVKILFYASYMLYHEVMILAPIIFNISEIHLIDVAYIGITDPKHFCFPALCEFVEYIYSLNPSVRIYLHEDPGELVKTVVFNKRFDVISALDWEFESHIVNHTDMIKNICIRTLKPGGSLFTTKTWKDVVETLHRRLTFCDTLITVRSEIYTYNTGYLSYLFKGLLCKTIYLLGSIVQAITPGFFIANSLIIYGLLFFNVIKITDISNYLYSVRNSINRLSRFKIFRFYNMIRYNQY